MSLFTLLFGKTPPRRRSSPAPSSPKPTFNHLLDTLAAQSANHHVGDLKDVTVRDILSAVGERSYGALLLLLGAVSISPLTIVPGANWFVASVTLLVALQATFSARHLWLPGSVLNLRLRRRAITDTIGKLRPAAHALDAVLKPRLPILTRPPFLNIAGLLCAIAALATFPLGLVPLGPVPPGLAIAFVGLGLFFRDGLITLLGLALTIGAAAFAFHLFG